MAAKGKSGGKGFDDPYPRQKPPEREEPANWKMVLLHIDHAQHAAKNEAKDKDIVADVEENLKKALHYLHPPPLE